MCMTVVLYARRKGWALSKVMADLQHEKLPASSVPEAQGREGTVDWIQAHLELDGDLSDEQYTRLLEISHRCPVKKTLTSGVVIVSK
jgi:putative redox protein